MDWLTTLRRSGGINALSRQLGVSVPEVARGAQALLPALIEGLRQVADARGGGETGVRALIDQLRELGGGELSASVMAPGPLDVAPGETIVASAIGPDVARRAVLIEAERTSGVAPDLGERILPGLAMLVGGYITARVEGSGAEGSGGLESALATLNAAQRDKTSVDRI